MRLIFFIIFLSIIGACSNNTYYSERTIKNERIAFTHKINTEIIGSSLNQPFDSVNWNGVFWASYMFNQNSDTIHKVLSRAYKRYEDLSSYQKYLFWLTASTQPEAIVKDSLQKLALKQKSPKLKAAAAQLFLQDTSFIHALFSKDTSLYAALQQSELKKNEPISRDEITQLLSSKLFKGRKNLLCLMQEDRNQPGVIFIIDSAGSILQSGEKALTFRYLARSATNFPYFLTNGNTPCGIYSIQGISNSSNVFIGPVPTIQTAMPFELTPKDFFHNCIDDTVWTNLLYSNMTGATHPQLFESYLAGKLGRAEIIIHGSTINPEYYSGLPFYPLTPSLGCISAYENWNTSSGKLMASNQLKLVSAYKKQPGAYGYLILVNADDTAIKYFANNINKN